MFKIFIIAISISFTYAKDIKLLNVSYDPTREFYRAFNSNFTKYYKEKTGNNLTILQSHGGSGSQARSVIDGLEADVVTLALAYDIDAISIFGNKLDSNWQSKFANDSSPYTSTIVFLVKKGNPKNIKDWDDLTKNGIKVITPNPKSSGGARWNYLAAWAYAQKKYGDNNAREFISKIYKNVPILDSGARGSTNTFVKRNIGDVLISWENEAHLIVEQLGKGKFEIVVPSFSILAQPPVAIVDRSVDKNGKREVAQEYLNYLYSPQAQEIIAQHYYRPINEDILAKYQNIFPALELVDISFFNGWQEAHNIHFSDGGEFDKIYSNIKR